MKQLTLTPSRAREIILHAGGLAKRGQFGKGPEAVFKLIEHLGFVQIDTNYVVERAHHHAIFSRVPDYKPEWLDHLQEDDRVFEYLTYASGYMPMEDYRFSLPVKEHYLARWSSLPALELSVMNKVLDRVVRDGPQMARDFENDRVEASSGWWDWRPSKLALERLYFDGRLMTTHRKDFQKVFDLPVNRVPGDIDKTMPGAEEYARYVILRTLQTFGISYIKEINWRTRRLKCPIKEELAKLIEEGKVCQVAIEGKKTQALYMLSGYQKKKITLSGDAFILSPFDTLNVLRHRLRDFFDFDYQVECFVPEAKRKYGYFSLPVLIGDRFVARMDAKADRKEKVLNVLNLHFEKVKLSQADSVRFREALAAFAKFNNCREIRILKTNNKTAGKAVRPV